MNRAVVVSCVRTGIGKFGGQWSTLEPDKMAGMVIKEAVARAGVDPAEVEDVVMGNIHGIHGNIARMAALYAGLPVEVAATTVDRQCGSGSQAIINAALNIMTGNGDIYVAAGMESMTQTPYQLHKQSRAFSPTAPVFVKNRYAPPEMFEDLTMPQTVDKLAAMKGITREECDQFAYMSHQRAIKAIDTGVFKPEILEIEVKTRKGTVKVGADECVRRDANLEIMSKLPPLYAGGVTTAANSCPRSDGAGALVIMSEERAKSMGLKPLACIRGFGAVGLDPTIMGYGPVPAVTKALKRTGLTVKDIDCVEINEAFAGQSIACIRDLGLNIERVNPNGGAIAMGHPLGGTGAILATKLINEMIRKDYTLGIVTMCCGGGQGMATVFERI